LQVKADGFSIGFFSNNSKIVIIGSEKAGVPILLQPKVGASKP
jgi:hypothetical protein